MRFCFEPLFELKRAVEIHGGRFGGLYSPRQFLTPAGPEELGIPVEGCGPPRLNSRHCGRGPHHDSLFGSKM